MRDATDVLEQSRDVLNDVMDEEHILSRSRALARIAVTKTLAEASATPLCKGGDASRRSIQIRKIAANFGTCMRARNAVAPLYVVLVCMYTSPAFEGWCRDRCPPKFDSFMVVLRDLLSAATSPDGRPSSIFEHVIVERACVAYRVAPSLTT